MQTAASLRSGVQYRRDRMVAADMIITDEAAALAGTSRVTINAWIKSGCCVGVCPTCAMASSCCGGSSSPDSLPEAVDAENWEVEF